MVFTILPDIVRPNLREKMKAIRIVLSTVLLAIAGILLVPAAASAEPVKIYAALGDSSPSGVGADVYKSPVGVNVGNINMSTYEPATVTNQCFRNNNAYPRQIATAKGYDLKFVACSGATTQDVVTGKSGEPSQLDALSSETDVVTLTVGGNDSGFIGVMQCIIAQNCVATNPTVQSAMSIVANDLPAKYDSLLGKIASRAPNAKIVLVGYGVTLPNQAYQDPYFTTEERQVALNLRNALNGALGAAAVRNGVEYVDPFASGSPFNRADASAGNVFTPSATWAVRAEFAFPNFWSSFHQTKKGHDYYAAIVGPRL